MFHFQVVFIDFFLTIHFALFVNAVLKLTLNNFKIFNQGFEETWNPLLVDQFKQ